MKADKLKNMYVWIIGYGIIAIIVGTTCLGFEKDIYIGLLLGVGSLTINFGLLTYIIDSMIRKEKTFIIFPISLGRFFIFAAAGWFALQQSYMCLLFFTTGILAMPVSAFISTIWEVRCDSLR